MYFVWVYAHELQHLIQDLKFPELSEVETFIINTINTVDSQPRTQLELPAEFDSELKAKELVLKLFGQTSFDSYIAEESSQTQRS